MIDRNSYGRRYIAAITFMFITSPLTAVAAGGAGKPTIVGADDVRYVAAPAPYPTAARMAVLSGNPSKAGSQYTVRLELPDGVKIGAHTHGDTENVTVIRGVLLVGVGTSFDATKMLPLTAGSYASIPAGTPHFAMARGATVVQVNGIGPASMQLEK